MFKVATAPGFVQSGTLSLVTSWFYQKNKDKMPSIANQSILILGGSSGLGYAVAQLTLAQNMRVFISSSNPTRISNAVDSLHKEFPSGSIVGFPCDLKSASVESNLENLFLQVIAANNGQLLDHIVFTAGDKLATKSLLEIDIAFIHTAGQVRFVAPLLIGKLATRFVKQSYVSSFTITNGAVAQKPLADWSVVAGYMSGLEGVVRNLALELKPIRVNLVTPGTVDTELWGTEEERRSFIEGWSKKSFQGRVASAQEAGEAYLYLLKDTNATGSVVSTNGGYLL
jgi:NAD(P)-dependent dehydrogenase (short-subunit alcohol dehydrogenase family)